MAVKKKSSGGGGANWMDTYGDMVTLLLCFFVLLYSLSTISEDKWKALVQSFNPNAIPAATEIEGGNDGPSSDELGESGVMDMQQADVEDMMKELFEAIQNYTKQEGIESAVAVEMEGGLIYLTFSDRVMFGGNSSELLPQGREVLGHVCAMLDSAKDAIEEIHVQGHTAQQYDNRPNAIPGDRRLASERACNVVIFLEQNSSIPGYRLVDMGYGQWRPIANNKTEATRAPNRRVEMVISAKEIGSELGDTLAQYSTMAIQDPNKESQPAATQAP